MLKLTLKVVAFIGLVLAIVWIFSDPNIFEPWITAIAALVVFLGLFLPDMLRRRKDQHQHVSDNSAGMQAGGDITINVNSTKERH